MEMENGNNGWAGRGLKSPTYRCGVHISSYAESGKPRVCDVVVGVTSMEGADTK